MTVEPGFGGQAFMPQQLGHIGRIRDLAAARGWRLAIEVDGGIAPETAGACVRQGARLLVAGQAVFGQADRARAIAELIAACAAGQV